MKAPKLKPPSDLLPAGLKATLEFTIPGPPIGKARARVTRYGTYTPKKTRNYEKHIRGCVGAALLANRDWPRDDVPTDWYLLEIDIHHELGPRWPDADNVLKSVMDALIDIVWFDDNRVIPRVMRVVLDSPDPRVEVTIMRIPVLERIS